MDGWTTRVAPYIGSFLQINRQQLDGGVLDNNTDPCGCRIDNWVMHASNLGPTGYPHPETQHEYRQAGAISFEGCQKGAGECAHLRKYTGRRRPRQL